MTEHQALLERCADAAEAGHGIMLNDSEVRVALVALLRKNAPCPLCSRNFPPPTGATP